MGGGVLPGGDILALLPEYPGVLLLSHLPALPVLHGLPGDRGLPLHILAAPGQLVLVLWMQLCLPGPLWSLPSTLSQTAIWLCGSGGIGGTGGVVSGGGALVHLPHVRATTCLPGGVVSG